MTSSSLLCFICISKGLMSLLLKTAVLLVYHFPERSLFFHLLFYSLALIAPSVASSFYFLFNKIFPLFPALSLHVPSMPHLPPAPQAVATCALQSASPVRCCLPRLPRHPLLSPCAFRTLCLIYELPVAPVMSHLGHRKAQCK